MISTSSPADATGILGAVRDLQAAELAAAAGILARAADWADVHPALTRASAATVSCRGEDLGFPIAGAGAPLVEATCVAELAAVLHLSTEAGQRLIGDALELRHRLPGLWRLVHAHRVPAWQARRVAQRTLHLSVDAAAYVDRQVSAVVGRIGPRQLDTLVECAIARFMPERAEERARQRAETRCFTITHSAGEDLSGLSQVYGVLDPADALDLDAAITDQAAAQLALGSSDPLDVRRARAAGDLARRQPCLALEPPDDQSTPSAAPRPRQITLYLHLSDVALTGGSSIGRIGTTQVPVTSEQIRAWCGQQDTQVTVKPVIDLNDTVSVDAYEVPDRIRERVALRDVRCAFPWCARLAQPASGRTTRSGLPVRPVDCDHIEPYDRGGPPGQTSTVNLAPLCRRHHRLKTHTGWRYRVHDRPGSYRWTSPHGLIFVRDHTGTRELDPDVVGDG